ncbi:MAG: ATP-binding protein [Flavobacteriales bacterium]|nr:ATP-binding protein [Flavobacteriales bacterium]MBL6872691.1 ATP-binding protein [Flavobacteriales bacterium]
MKKIVIIGPECTGKSTLTKALANHFNTAYVREYAREYIDNLNGNYKEDDILTIAQKQIELEDNAIANNKYLFLDTDLIVCKVWSEFKYGQCNPWILKQIEKRHYDYYLLCDIDIPWINDGQREHPNHRQELFDTYNIELTELNKSFTVISGENRLQDSIDFLQSLDI